MMSDLPPEKRIERLITAGARVITLWNDPTIDPHGQWGPAGLRDLAVRDVSQTALLNELKSDDPHRRAAACAIVGFARDSSQQRINLIRPLLDDPVPVVRRAAVFATASVSGEPAKTLGPRIRELAEHDQSPEVRTEAEMALRLIEAQR